MRFSTALAVVLMCTLIDAAQGEGPVNTLDTAQSRIDGLVDKLRSGSVQRIEIVQIPSRILTRTRVTPEMLERSFHYKLVVRDIRGGPCCELDSCACVDLRGPGFRDGGFALGHRIL